MQIEALLIETLKSQSLVLEELKPLYLNLKAALSKRDEITVKDITEKSGVLIEKFRELEDERRDVWSELTKDKVFSSTYEAVEKLISFEKRENVLNYINKIKMEVLNLKALTFLIESYVGTAMDIIELTFDAIHEESKGGTYQNPYRVKKNNENIAPILINKKL